MAEQCSSCASPRLEPATLLSAAVVLQRASAWKKAVGGAAEVSCRVCLDCGAIDQLKANAETLQKSVE
jgi:hypothetical protein